MRPEPRSDSPRFPNGFQAFLLIVGLLLAEVLAGTLLREAQGLLQLQPHQRMALTVLLGNAMVFVVVMPLTGLDYRRLFHAAAVPRRALLVLVVPPVLLLVPALLLAGGLISWLTERVFGLSAWEQSFFGEMAQPDLAMGLMVCALAPVLEEMLFRGIVLRGFLTRYSPGVAIGASAVAFGFAHFNVHQFVGAFLIGLLLGWLYERTRSLWPSIALHAGYNAAVTVVAGQLQDDLAIDGGQVVLWLLVALALAVPAALALRRMLRIRAPAAD